MGDWEDKLSPLARERLARIGDATPEEKEKLKGSEQLHSLLSEFYKGQLDSEGLWRGLRDYRENGKGYLLIEAQMKLIDSIGMASSAAEFQRRKEGVLAIETLKEEQNTSVLEPGMNLIEDLQRRYEEEKQQAYNNLKARIEKNPELRMQQVKQGQNMVITQLSVDEAVKRNPQWQEFLIHHERIYDQEFAKLIDRLKTEVK